MIFFLNIYEFLVQIIPEGGAPGGHNPPRRASTPRCALVGAAHLVGPFTYFFLPHYSIHPEKNRQHTLSRVLAPETVDFDLFARSSVSETVSSICCLVCDSSMCPLVFVLVVYI